MHETCAQAAVLNAKGVNPDGKVRPSILALSRQGMPNLPTTSKEAVLKGGYIVHGGDAKPDVIFIATGAVSLPPCLVTLIVMSSSRSSFLREATVL